MKTANHFILPARSRPLPHCRIRPIQEEDFEACTEIYHLNAPGRFPEGVFDEFSKELQNPDSLTLVAEVAGQIRGLGSITLYQNAQNGNWTQQACLSFGMVHPEYHRCGFGTLLLLARLAALPLPNPSLIVYLTTILCSESFYRRYGFVCHKQYTDKDGTLLKQHSLYFNQSSWQLCRTVLKQTNLILDANTNFPAHRGTQIQTHSVPADSGSGTQITVKAQRDHFILRPRHTPWPRCQIRRIGKRDLAACEEIYRLNEPAGFPTGHFDEFSAHLKNADTLILVVEAAGMIRGFGAVAIYRKSPENSGESTPANPPREWASLSYGMVHPAYHKQGFGTLLLLARLAALPQPESQWLIRIAAIGSSESFHQKFGFAHLGEHIQVKETSLKIYQVRLHRSDWQRCQTALTQANVTLDIADVEVPTRTVP